MYNGSVKKNMELFKDEKYSDLSTRELFDAYEKDKCREIRNEIVNRNLYIAELLAKKYVGRGIEFEDIFQVASLALILAVERFDVSKGFEFSSFATPTIIGEIKRHFRDKGWAIKVPRKTQELSMKINETRNKLEQEMGSVPKVEDIANYLNCTSEEVMEAIEASQLFSIRSLDLLKENKDRDSEMSFIEILGKEDENFSNIENRDFIERFIEKLNDVEKKILIGRFYKGKTQVAIARELDLSQMTISRIEKKILSKLKEDYTKTVDL